MFWHQDHNLELEAGAKAKIKRDFFLGEF